MSSVILGQFSVNHLCGVFYFLWRLLLRVSWAQCRDFPLSCPASIHFSFKNKILFWHIMISSVLTSDPISNNCFSPSLLFQNSALYHEVNGTHTVLLLHTIKCKLQLSQVIFLSIFSPTIFGHLYPDIERKCLNKIASVLQFILCVHLYVKIIQRTVTWNFWWIGTQET